MDFYDALSTLANYNITSVKLKKKKKAESIFFMPNNFDPTEHVK